MINVLDFHLVTNGCNKKFPSEITSRPGNERHAVRCCDDIGATCISVQPCRLASTYQEANEYCLEQGLRLCKNNEKIDEICCGTGCEIDPVTMWLADEELDLHFVTNGCNKKFPREITFHSGSERHAVRCCDDVGETCISSQPCMLASTYQEANEYCLDQGLRLCKNNEKLNDICCGTGCEIDPVTMWISDEGLGKYMIC